MTDLISRADAIKAIRKCKFESVISLDWYRGMECAQDIVKGLPSADAVTIHEDGTLEVKVSNAHKVGRVLVMDTDSHIGGGLFYPDDSDAEWIPVSERLPERDEIVLVSYKTMGTVHMCKYLDDGSENPWWSYNDDCLAWNNVILAWMPLPKPYREDGEQE